MLTQQACRLEKGLLAWRVATGSGQEGAGSRSFRLHWSSSASLQMTSVPSNLDFQGFF